MNDVQMNGNVKTKQELPGPTAADQRIDLLDSLRGFALFGIMFVNMTWFTGFAVLSPEQKSELGTEQIDAVVYWLINWLVDGKFWAMFAMLFGVGIAMQLARADERKENFVPILVRRLSVLVVIGLMHAIFLWFGDIVSLYAVVGFGLLFFFRMSNQLMLCWAIALMSVPVVQSAVWVMVDPNFDTSHGPYDQLGDFGGGTYAEMFATNWAFLVKRWILAVYSGRFFQLLGMFLLGFWAARSQVFQSPDRYRRFLQMTLVWGLLMGLPLNALIVANPEPASQLVGWLFRAAKSIGIPVLCLAYAAGFILLYQRIKARPNNFMWIFQHVGRMTLTNYIAQSVIGIAIFYGCGFGNWGGIGMTLAIPLIVVIFVAQSLLSMIWLRRYRQGPLEWGWRCMTYGRMLPLKRDRLAINNA